MSEKPFIHLERGKQIAMLHAEGLSQRQIAAALHISQPVARRWLIRLGLVPQSRCDYIRPSARLQAHVRTLLPCRSQESDTLMKPGLEQSEKRAAEAIDALRALGWEMAGRREISLGDAHRWGQQLLALAATIEKAGDTLFTISESAAVR
jgi:hypothetical protein